MRTGDCSIGMILALGARNLAFNFRITPLFYRSWTANRIANTNRNTSIHTNTNINIHSNANANGTANINAHSNSNSTWSFVTNNERSRSRRSPIYETFGSSEYSKR
jgi:hypothetical protein